MLEKLNKEILTQHLILSNTPFYLYKKFSNDESVKALSEKNSTKKLIKYLNKFMEIEITEIEQFVIIYALIFALSYKPKHEVLSFFSKIDKMNIKWNKYIKEIYFSKIIPESFASIDLNYQLKLSKANTNSLAENKTINIKQVTNIKIKTE